MTDQLIDIAVVALDRQGCGVTEDGLAVAGALPGERALIRQTDSRAELVEITAPSPARVEPFCPWFGRCGGCATQHMSDDLYRAWKRDLVVDALARAGVAAEVGPLVDAHGAGRRRATFHARFPPGGTDEVGFMRARSHEIVGIDRCPLFAPGMAGAVQAARTLAADLRGTAKPLDIGVTATLDGLDVDLRGSGPLGPAETRKLIHTAEALDLARISNHGVVVIERQPPRVAFGEALVAPPPGGFLQATETGEQALADFAENALAGAKRVADLFCGAGAFALRLARTHHVFAVDSDDAAIAALRKGAAGARGPRRPVTAEARDLYRRPLNPDELAAFDAVLFDPPRAGAQAQAIALAASALKCIVAVSCNAGTFARDARILLDGGRFTIEKVTPLDQFRDSAHVEITAVFRQTNRKRGARRLLG